jgi:alpha-glucosidase
LIVDEAGVGRGLSPITQFENLNHGQGGNPVTSYGPAVSYITTKKRAFVIDPLNIGIAYFTDLSYHKMLYWHSQKITGTIISGENPMELA